MVLAVLNNKPQKCIADKTVEETGADLAERLGGSVDGATFKGCVNGKPYSVDMQLISKEDLNREKEEME